MRNIKHIKLIDTVCFDIVLCPSHITILNGMFTIQKNRKQIHFKQGRFVYYESNY